MIRSSTLWAIGDFMRHLTARLLPPGGDVGTAAELDELFLPMPSRPFTIQPTSQWRVPGSFAEENQRLRKALTPRQWTKAQNDAWHQALPDVEKAFADLFAATENPGNLP